MSKTFIEAKTYVNLLEKPIFFNNQVSFPSNCTIQIALSSQGGFGGFGPIGINDIVIKSEADDKYFTEIMSSEQGTPISSFIEQNLDVLFKKII